MSRRPYRSSADPTIASTESILPTSAWIEKASPEPLLMFLTVSAAPVPSISATTTLAPWRENNWAVARPIPEAAPVIRATLSCNNMAVLLLKYQRIPKPQSLVEGEVRRPVCPA